MSNLLCQHGRPQDALYSCIVTYACLSLDKLDRPRQRLLTRGSQIAMTCNTHPEYSPGCCLIFSELLMQPLAHCRSIGQSDLCAPARSRYVFKDMAMLQEYRHMHARGLEQSARQRKQWSPPHSLNTHFAATCSTKGTPVPCSTDLHVFWVGGPTKWGAPSAGPPWSQWGHEALMQRLAGCHLGTAQPRPRRGCHPTSGIVILLSLMWILAHQPSTPEPATILTIKSHEYTVVELIMMANIGQC